MHSLNKLGCLEGSAWKLSKRVAEGGDKACVCILKRLVCDIEVSQLEGRISIEN